MDAYVASLQPLYAKLAQQPGALDKVTRRIARAEVQFCASATFTGAEAGAEAELVYACGPSSLSLGRNVPSREGDTCLQCTIKAPPKHARAHPEPD